VNSTALNTSLQHTSHNPNIRRAPDENEIEDEAKDCWFLVLMRTEPRSGAVSSAKAVHAL